MDGPFRPLAPFGSADKALFFGRDREADALGTILQSHRTALLHGEAGAGKTSLVHAAIAPRLRARGTEVASVDLAGGVPVGFPPSSAPERLAVLDGIGALLDDATARLQLVGLVREGARAGWRLLFVIDDEDLGPFLALEDQVGPLAPPGARVGLERFDLATCTDAIEQTVLGGGVYVEAGLSGVIAADLALGGPVSPCTLQIVCSQALVAEHVTTARSYRATGGSEALVHRFFERVCRAGGAPAAGVLGAAAWAPAHGERSVADLAAEEGTSEREAEKAAHALVEASLLAAGRSGYRLSNEWLRGPARNFVAERYAARARVRRVLKAKVDAGGLLGPMQLREVVRHAGPLDSDERRTVTRSRTVWRSALAVAVCAPIVAIVLTWAGYGKRYHLDLVNGEVAARLGPRTAVLGFLPHRPPLGAVVGESGFARGALASDVVGKEGPLDDEAWLRATAAALSPLPRAVTALALDGDAAPIAELAREPREKARAVEILALLGRGSKEEGEVLRAALSDPSEEVRRRAVAAAVAVEARAPGSAGPALQAALDDKAPSVRNAAIEALAARGASASELLARALGSSDPSLRKRAMAALQPALAAHPEAAPQVAAQLTGPGRAEVESLLGKLLEGEAAAGKFAVQALAELAGDEKAPLESRLAALKLLRKAQAAPPELLEKALAGPPAVAGAALPLLARLDAAKALARLPQAAAGKTPLRAGAAAALAFLPRDADTAKRFHTALVDGSAEVRAEAVRAAPLGMGREALTVIDKVLRGENSEVQRAAVQALADSPKLGGEATSLLERTAQKGSSSLKRLALEALGQSRANGAADSLGRLGRGVDTSIHLEAAAALGQLAANGNGQAVSSLRSLARDADSSVRRRAAEALGVAKPAGAAVKALAGFLADTDPGVRAQAAASCDAQGARELLGPLLADKDAAVRAAARRGLAKGSRGGELDRVLGRAFAEADGGERAELMPLASASPALLQRAAADPDPEVRRATADAAAAGKVIAPLALLAGDADHEVRRAALRGLAAAGAVAELEQALAGESDPSLREAGLASLAAGGAAEARGRALLEKALDDASERTRAAAARGLGGHGEAARESLARALHDPASDVRSAAAEALGRVDATLPAADLTARLARSAGDAELRWSTAEALARQASDARHGAEALAALDQAAAKGPAVIRLSARIARAFVGRPDEMDPFVVAFRAGR